MRGIRLLAAFIAFAFAGCGLSQALIEKDRVVSHEKQEKELRGYGYCGANTYPDLDPCKAPDAMFWGLCLPGD